MCLPFLIKTSEFVFFAVHDILTILLINHISAACNLFQAPNQDSCVSLCLPSVSLSLRSSLAYLLIPGVLFRDTFRHVLK